MFASIKDLCAKKKPNRRHPDKHLENLLQVFRSARSVPYKKTEPQEPIAENEGNNILVIGCLAENSHRSQRKINETTGINRGSIRRIIKKNKFYPYHIQLYQELLEVDYDRRLECCLWVLKKLGDDENFLDYVLFSDELTFHNNGLVNRHNENYDGPSCIIKVAKCFNKKKPIISIKKSIELSSFIKSRPKISKEKCIFTMIKSNENQ